MLNVQDGPSAAPLGESSCWGMEQGDVWLLMIAGMRRWDVSSDGYRDAMLNGREGPSVTPWMDAVAGT